MHADPVAAVPQVRVINVHAAQAANVEVYVTQMPSQDAEACHARNVHSRSLEDISAAVGALEDAPPAAVRLDCACLVELPGQPPVPTSEAPDDTAAEAHPSEPDAKRKSADSPKGASEPKRAKSAEPEGAAGAGSSSSGKGAVSDSELLASVSQGLQAHAQGGARGGGEARSRWEDEDESDNGSAANGAGAGSGGRSNGVLKSRSSLGAWPAHVNLHVTWSTPVQRALFNAAMALRP